MKLHSVATDLGAAMLADLKEPLHPVTAPEGHGIVFWGRCDRATFGQILLGSKAKWIADYDVKRKLAIVMWPENLAGRAMEIDTAIVDPVCPECGSPEYISRGENWQCSRCDRQWRKAPKKRGRKARENLLAIP